MKRMGQEMGEDLGDDLDAAMDEAMSEGDGDGAGDGGLGAGSGLGDGGLSDEGCRRLAAALFWCAWSDLTALFDRVCRFLEKTDAAENRAQLGSPRRGRVAAEHRVDLRRGGVMTDLRLVTRARQLGQR